MCSRTNRYVNFINFLERFEKLACPDIKSAELHMMIFKDIVNYIINNRCSPHFNNFIPINSIYRQCVTNTKGIDGILIIHKSKLAVFIRYSRFINEPLSDNTLYAPSCIQLCKEQNISSVLVITNKTEVDHIIKEGFEEVGFSYNEFIRKDFSHINLHHINNILRLHSLGSLMTSSKKINCNVS